MVKKNKHERVIMTEITIEVSDKVKNLIEEIDEPLYMEAIKDVAKLKLAEKQKELKYLKRKAAKFESHYSIDFYNFSRNVPDNRKSHDDWIEWSYLTKTISEKQKKIEKLKMIIG